MGCFPLGARDGTTRTIVGSENTGAIERTYNLEVEDLHTFFVGNSQILVHNGCKRPNDFTRSTKGQIRRENPNCESCGQQTIWGTPDKKGVAPPENRSEIHHKKPAADGGSRDRSNGQNLCHKCHTEEHKKTE